MTDRVISSSDQFELPPGGRFGHTASNPTLFAADVAYLCVAGTLCLADPESGEVVLVPEGTGVYFGRDTWHHGFAVGPWTARVVEFMSPPPVLGTASTYGRTRLLLAETRYRDRRWEGRWPEALNEQRAGRRLVPLRVTDGLLSFRDASPGHLVWTLLDTPFLTVVRGEVQPGTVDEFTRQRKETVLRGLNLEGFVSGAGIAARWGSATGRTGRDARALLVAAESHEPTARAIAATAGQALAEGLAAVVHLLDPARIVLGGGLGCADTVARRALIRHWSQLGPPAELVIAELGPDGPLLGAGLARLARLTVKPAVGVGQTALRNRSAVNR